MRKANIIYPVFIFIIALIICGQNIWGSTIYILDEAKNATCAREMMNSGNLIVPTFNNELRTDKPPLHYYFMMSAYQLFGVNEFAARFFSSVFGALTVLITFLYTRKLLDEKTAAIAVVILLSSTHFVLQFHLAVPDPYLIFFLTLSGFAFLNGYVHQSKFSIYLAYASIGMGTLAKGPIAIALPGITIAAFILFSGRFNWKTIKAFHPFSGLLLALLIAAPWYVAVGVQTQGEWLQGFFLDHNLERFAEPQEGHGGRFWLTLVFVLGGMLPASVYVFQSFAQWWKGRKVDFLFFCGIYALIVIVFFALADTKLPNYTVPAYPFLSVLIAYYLKKVFSAEVTLTGFRISTLLILLVILSMPVGFFYGIKTDRTFGFLAQKALLFLPLSLLALAGLYLLYRNQLKSVAAVVALSFCYFTSIALNVIYPLIDDTNPVARILPQIDTSKPIAHYQRYNPSFSFYLKKPIPKLETSEDVHAFFEDHPDGLLITRSDFAPEISTLDNLVKEHEIQDLFETRNTVVYSCRSQKIP